MHHHYQSANLIHLFLHLSLMDSNG